MNSKNISRRNFVKTTASGIALVSLSSILPGSEARAAERISALNKKLSDGIYIVGGITNMNGQRYELEFIQPVKLCVYIDGIIQTEGTWRSKNKHYVSVDPDGTIIMRDGTSGHSVDVTWTLGLTQFSVTFVTRQTIGAECISTDRPLTRGQFMIMLDNAFGWKHYNGYLDDGTDIDANGELMDEERVRTFHDVTGVSDFVKSVECALDQGILHAESSEDRFYPMSDMTREDAAVILQKAFKIENAPNDFISAFSDASKVNRDCYDALNALIANGYLNPVNELCLGASEGITGTDARIAIDRIMRKRVAPVWSLPVSHRKFVRCRPIWKCATEGATVHWRTRAFNISHKQLEGMFIQDRGIGVKLVPEWGDWYDYKPGFSTDPMFGLNNCKDLPYDRIWFCVEVEAYATKPGLQDGPVSKFVWRIDRPAWHDFAFDVLHQGNADFPTVYRFFDNFQAAAYYIQGSEFGLLYDGLMPTNTTTSLYDKVKELATTDFAFVLGHEHGDHNGAMPDVYAAGKKVYLCKNVSSKGRSWTISTYSKDYTSSNRNVVSEKRGEYGENAIEIDEGYVFDLGNCKFKVYRLPGHETASMILHDAKHGLIFASDIYGVNRYWTADQFSAKGVKQDLLMSLQQQLMVEYRKNGGLIKEVYTGHNRSGVGPEYLNVWENCLQKIIDYGSEGVEDDRRGDGAILAKDGDSFSTLNWTGFSEDGKMKYVEYVGKYDGKTFHRIEVDNTGESPLIESNLYFKRSENSALSNLVVLDGELVGHDFFFRKGFNDEKTLAANGSDYKFVIKNKFVPYDYDYDVKVSKGQASVKIIPIACSSMIKSMTVNGKPAVSRCPIEVSTASNCHITVTAPDGKSTSEYTIRFIR